MVFSKKYKFFLFISAFVFVVNMLIMNEYTTIINEVESDFLLDVQTLLGKGELNLGAKALLPVWVDSIMYKSLGFNEFSLRFPNVAVLLLTFFGFYFFGKKIFGEKTTVVTLLVLGSSFLPVNLAKFATGDVWIFGAQLMSFVFMILYLKQPIGKWKWGVWLFVVLGALIHPLSMFIWSLGLWGYLRTIHPKGKNLKGLVMLPLLVIVYLPLWYFGLISLEMPHFLMGIGSEHFKYFFAIALLAILPWFGFLPASLWDMIQKLRKKEELAIINLGWILFAILSQSMIIVAAFSFLIAKNLLAYFDKNYPYRRLVKGFTLINMFFTFFLLFALLLGGFMNFQGEGYRSVFGLSILYWFGSMAAVLGLFMHKNSLVVGGMAVSGLMFTWLCWLQVNPLIESQRNFSQQVFQELKTQGVGRAGGNLKVTELYHLNSDSVFYQKNMKVYLQELNVKTVAVDSIKMVSMTSKDQNAFAAVSVPFFEKLPANHVFLQNKKYPITGGKDFLKAKEEYQLVEF
jgi:4-amino-4-deoxy-L-arabinose transferase-like glycosyltransferase